MAGGSAKPETCAAAIFSRDGEGGPLALNSVIFRLELPALMARIIFGADISLFQDGVS